MEKKSDVSKVADLVNGFQQSCVLVAMIQVGLVERLAQGPADVPTLAADLELHPPSLTRLLRALSGLGMARHDDSGWQLTSAGKLLGKDGMGAGIRAWAELVGGEYLGAWGGLRHSLQTGEPSFPAIFGETVWQHRQKNPALDDSFQRLTRGQQARAVSGLTRAYDFSAYSTVMDVGGGHGQLLAGLLQAYPTMNGVLFDLPHVIAGAEPLLEKAGVLKRCRLVSGSFLETPPETAKLYLLKHVLHNWNDAQCRTILQHLAGAMEQGGKLLVLENLLPEDDGEVDLPLAMLDLHMLAVLGGQERKASEYASLLAAAGLRLQRHLTTRVGAPDILEATLEEC
jgi:hypothetical protein